MTTPQPDYELWLALVRDLCDEGDESWAYLAANELARVLMAKNAAA